MSEKQSYLNVFELNRAPERDTMINRTILSLLLEKGVISSDESEKKLRELVQNQQIKGS